MRLHRRAAGRVDQQRDRASTRPCEGALERLRHRGERQPGPQRRREPDHAGEPHHRYDRRVAAKAPRQHGLEERGGPLEKSCFGHDQHIGFCCRAQAAISARFAAAQDGFGLRARLPCSSLSVRPGEKRSGARAVLDCANKDADRRQRTARIDRHDRNTAKSRERGENLCQPIGAPDQRERAVPAAAASARGRPIAAECPGLPHMSDGGVAVSGETFCRAGSLKGGFINTHWMRSIGSIVRRKSFTLAATSSSAT